MTLHAHAHDHDHAKPERLPVIRGREQAAPFSAKVDVVIVGSGAGGAVLARELAGTGGASSCSRRAAHYSPAEYGAMTPSNSFRRLSREAGMSVALGVGDTPLISLLAGKCVGGSSVLTGGVCFRIPEEVLHTWSGELGLDRMTPDGLDPFFSEVERICHVEDVPLHMRSRATELFVEGADKLGITMKTMRRNTKGCRGAGRCNFGCPHGAKMSVDVSFLPDAVAHGATVVSDALVERIDITGGTARGVRGRFLDGVTGEPRCASRCARSSSSSRADRCTRRSFSGRAASTRSTLAGTSRSTPPSASAPSSTKRSTAGMARSRASTPITSSREGIWLNGVYSPVNVLAAAFPGVGREHRRLVKQMPNLAFFGGMVHDDGGGQVRRWLSREPLVTYKMVKRDKARLLKAIHILGRMAFAAGAREVLTPVFGLPTVKKEKDLDFLLEDKIPASKVECMAFHPLGSAKMATTPEAGVVKPNGRDVGGRQPVRLRRERPADEHRRELAATDHERHDDARARHRGRLRALRQPRLNARDSNRKARRREERGSSHDRSRLPVFPSSCGLALSA